MAGFYELKSPNSPWGDYSDILISGMSAYSARKDGLIQFERTGPYVPPISFPGIGDIVVTDTFRRKLESSGLSGLRFQPVIKKRIVHLDWHLWDQAAKEPLEYPQGGEPEGYILQRPHSPEVAEQIGDLWELCLTEAAKIHRERRPSRILLVASSLQGCDIFRAEGVLCSYTTDRAKTWLEDNAKEHVAFAEVETV
jgi:hypothetical protein